MVPRLENNRVAKSEDRNQSSPPWTLERQLRIYGQRLTLRTKDSYRNSDYLGVTRSTKCC